MPPHSEEIVLLPVGPDPDKMQEYRRRIERFQAGLRAARARNIEAQRRYRIFTGVIIGGIFLTAALSAYVAWSLSRLKRTVSAQLQAAVAASDDRWKDIQQALVEDRNALQATEQMLARFRAETRVRLLLPYLDVYLARRLAPDASTDRAVVSARLKDVVRPALIRELTLMPETTDAQVASAIEKLVDERLPPILQRTRRPAQ